MVRFVLLIGLLWSTYAQAAEIKPPSGWVAEADVDAMMWTKPAHTGDTNIGIAFDLVDSAPGALAAWFKGEVDALSNAEEVSDRQPVTTQGRLVRTSFLLGKDGDRMRAYVFAYQTQKGKQIIMVATDPGIQARDPVVHEAFRIVTLASERDAYYADRVLFALRPDPHQPKATR